MRPEVPEPLQLQVRQLPTISPLDVEGFTSNSQKAISEKYQLVSAFTNMGSPLKITSETIQWHPSGFQISQEAP